QKAEQIASQLGEESLFGGDANRVNSELAKIEAVTAADIQAAADKYLQPQMGTVLYVKPDPLGKEARTTAAEAEATVNAPVAPATRPIEPRVVQFPPGYPEKAPVADVATIPEFQKGSEI